MPPVYTDINLHTILDLTRNLLDRAKKPNFIVKNAYSIPPACIRRAKQLLYTTPFLTYIYKNGMPFNRTAFRFFHFHKELFIQFLILIDFLFLRQVESQCAAWVHDAVRVKVLLEGAEDFIFVVTDRIF